MRNLDKPRSYNAKKWTVRKEIRVFGLRRSGNHAIINWIMKQSPGNIFFLNNGDILGSFDKHWNYKDPPNEIDLFIHSYETHRFSPRVLDIANKNRDQFFDKPAERYELLILRDPFNLFASRLKSGKISPGRGDRYDQVDLWLCYADEFCGKTNYLGTSKILVNYNRWCADTAYRKSIAQQLKLVFSDSGFDEVPRYGGGSSFDGRDKNGVASDMHTDSRWKQFVTDHSFISCFHDPRVLSASRQIFDDIPEARKVIENSISNSQRWRAIGRGFWTRRIIMPLIDLRLWYDRNQYLVAKAE